ncbi:thiamine pyrophosphate-dependent enzyme [Desulfovibrio sp.]|uniref:thiamine pyrophosphate-dependent enzyme n=1 Tax=Desulfovibrio sp. TaxID=885 RepID=UPI003D0DF355
MSQALSRSLLNRSALPLMWCAGCGNGIVLNALLCAMDELDMKKENVLIVTGIGCWGKADDYISANALHVTHGRALAFATGAKAANPELNVIVLMGDGDGTTIGGNHLIHTARRNMDLTAIIVNNLNYGMTGGQYSATTPSGAITSTSIGGNPERGFDVCGLVSAAGANYVARESVSSGMRLKNRIVSGIRKKGFSLIEAMSPCSTLFGPRNKMRQPVEMLRNLKEKAVSQAKFDSIENAEDQGYFVAGVIADRDVHDFSTRYEAEREVIMAARGRK